MAPLALHLFDDHKTLTVRFILQDPLPLTGKPDREVLLPAAPGQSLLAVALEGGIHLEHTCGGVGACSTCHLYVNAGAHLLSAPHEEESDRLDVAPMVKPKSRLACQAYILPGADPAQIQIEVEIPAWNRNLIRESHH